MKSQETDIRDHETDTAAFRAAVKRSREANGKRQAEEMTRIFGPDRTNPDPDKPPAGGNGWSI
jgi:hypothetical protein